MVLEDKIVCLRLHHEPEFLLRMHETRVNWGDPNAPALIVQARPIRGSVVLADIDESIVRLMREGSGDSDSFWHGFQSGYMPKPTLHGIVGLSDWTNPEWVFEFHRDGHFLAAVSNFPSLSNGGKEQLVIADFYAQFFHDFFALTSKLATAAHIGGSYLATASLLNARQLRFSAERGNTLRIEGGPCAFENLQWAVHQAHIATDSWQKLGHSLGTGIAGGYRSKQA